MASRWISPALLLAALVVPAGAQTTPAKPPPPPAPQAPVESRIPDSVKARQTITDDSNAAARIDNEPVDPSLPGFFLLPGTSTSLRIGGYVRADVLHDFEPIGNRDEFVVSSIPIDVVSGADNTQVHARQTRFNVELRREARTGPVRVFFEFDFFGAAGERGLNVRHAYGQTANVLAGLTSSTLQDLDVRPDTLDHEGPPGRVAVRHAQVRYTHPLPHGQSVAFAVEEPLVDVPAAAGGEAVTPRSPWPDIVVRYRIDGQRGHLQSGFVLRSIGGFAGDGVTEVHEAGRGVAVSGSWLFGKLHTIVFEASGGKGFARYIKDMAGHGLDLAAADSGEIVAPGVVAGYAGFQRVWSPRLRSTLAGSFDRLTNTTGQPADAYRDALYTTVNLVFRPIPTLTLGVEYGYGRFEVKDGRRNGASRVQAAVQLDLLR